jgi:hypothetical protein
LTKASTCALEGKGDSSATEGCGDHQALIVQRQRLIDTIDNSMLLRSISAPQVDDNRNPRQTPRSPASLVRHVGG